MDASGERLLLFVEGNFFGGRTTCVCVHACVRRAACACSCWGNFQKMNYDNGLLLLLLFEGRSRSIIICMVALRLVAALMAAEL